MGGAEMVTITDSGCHTHQPCQITFNGVRARMVERFISNLPTNGGKFTYICELGHTHLVLPFPDKRGLGVTAAGIGNLTPEMLIDLMA